MKKTFLSICISIFLVILAWLLVGVEQKNDTNAYASRKMVTVIYSGGHIDRVMLREDAQAWVRAIVDRVYTQATLHNPEGDKIPDAWDDSVKTFVKESLGE